MNYEEKYKEAIESIKRIYNQADSYGKELMEKEFHELRESEDEKIRKEIVQFLQLPHPQFVGKRNYEEWITWLEKQGEKPAEWSEEDEDARDIAIRIIQNDGDDCAGILDSDKALNWLKSIKPQPHWKPSKEQMEALKKRTHGLHTSSETRKALESLIDDLKKL